MKRTNFSATMRYLAQTKPCACAASVVLVLWLAAASLSAGEVVDVRDFGALGDGVTDDTEAIRRALAASSSVHFPSGVYVLTDGLALPESAQLTGDGSPRLGTFPLDDDKRFLTPDRIRDLPGSTLLFRGTGRQTAATGRMDGFRELRYAVKTFPEFAFRIERLAIVMDVRVEDAEGQPTTPANDHRASYDVGLLVDDAAGGTVRDVAVFGYFERAGLCVVSRRAGSNPDYNTFWNCAFSGEYGVALLGSDQEAGPGLSGTQFHGCLLFANDHHCRASGQWGSAALLIDGATKGKRADINGHYFFGGAIRTYANTAVKLDRASNISFHGVVFEVPGFDGPNAAGADQSGKVVGTARTRDVFFVGCRMHGLGLSELGQAMTDGNLYVLGDPRRGIAVHADGRVARLYVTGGGDPVMQWSEEGESSVSGWTLRLDTSEQQELALRYDNQFRAGIDRDGTLRVKDAQVDRVRAADLSLGQAEFTTIQNGVAEVTASRLSLSSANTAQLRILRGGREGQIAILQLAANSRPIEVLASVDGNLEIPRPMRLEGPCDRLTLIREGDRWVQLARSEAGGE